MNTPNSSDDLPTLITAVKTPKKSKLNLKLVQTAKEDSLLSDYQLDDNNASY